MKLKRWLSRGIVLAMVVALMVPMPVAAKSGKSGGKLVKSVTEYTYSEKSGRWTAEGQTTYKYDKKNYPAEIGHIYYGDDTFLGVPVGGTKYVETAKYKYKGKNPKSAKFKDGAGKVTETRKYKKGRVVSVVSSKKTSTESLDNNGTYNGDNVYATASSEKYTYNKKGLVTSAVFADAKNSARISGDSWSENSTDTYTYAVTQKKGIPSFTLCTRAGVGASADAEGTSSWQRNADGTYTEVVNGETSTGKSTYVWQYYTTYNKKGLAVESGEIELNTETGAKVIFPEYRVDYTNKKGKVTQAIVYSYETNDETGAVTKTTPVRLYKFKYAKKKISKVRYLSMINDLIDYNNGCFNWY